MGLFSSPSLKGTVIYHFPIYFRVIPEDHLTVPYLIKLDYPNTNCVELYPGEHDVQKKVRLKNVNDCDPSSNPEKHVNFILAIDFSTGYF